VKYKTAYYSFYLPVAMAMLMTGRFSEADYKEAEDILVPMGKYFQVQVWKIDINIEIYT